MKKYFLLLFVLFVLPARAATMCAPIPVDDMYSGLVESIAMERMSTVDWGLIYENGLTIVGIAVCADVNNNASWTNRVIDRIVYSGNKDSNYACYCKVAKPAISAWYFADNMMSGEDCLINCAEKCEFTALDNYDFWPSLLPTMQN